MIHQLMMILDMTEDTRNEQGRIGQVALDKWWYRIRVVIAGVAPSEALFELSSLTALWPMVD